MLDIALVSSCRRCILLFFANELSCINIPLMKALCAIQRVEEWGTDPWLLRNKSVKWSQICSAYGDICMTWVLALQILDGFEDVEGAMVILTGAWSDHVMG